MRQLGLILVLISGLGVALHGTVVAIIGYQAVSVLGVMNGTAWDTSLAVASDSLLGSVDGLRRIIFLISALIFMVWVYRVLKEIETRGITLARSPGAAVGLMVVPFANLVAAPMAVGEIHTYLFSEERVSSNKKVIAIWWGCYLIGSIALLIVTTVGKEAIKSNDLQAIFNLIIGQFIVYIILTVAGFFFVKIIRQISTELNSPQPIVVEAHVFD